MAAITLHSGTATGDGGEIQNNAPLVTLQAFLGSGGGSATCNVYGKLLASAPWELLCTFTLSGANDSSAYILDEKWAFLKGNISAISSATATIAMVV